MVADSRPILVLIAGPNGAGKSTLYETRLAPRLAVPFINADLIQRDELEDKRPEAAYDAAQLAEARRRQHLKDGMSLVTETVFSHPSKLSLIDEAKAAGFRVFLLHVGLEAAALAVARVQGRVREGGHHVPEEKVRERYDRNAPLIRQAVLRSDLAHVYDNSKLNLPPERMLSFRAGQMSFVAPYLPKWVLALYGPDLPS